MSRPTLSELTDIWRYTYARSAHFEVVSNLWVLEKLDGPEEMMGPLRRAVVGSTVVSYARPFTASQIDKKTRIRALQDAPLPPDLGLREEHERILYLRDKAIGHKDATEWKTGVPGPNRVIVRRKKAGGFDIHTVTLEGFDEIVVGRLKLLCAHYITHCESKLSPFMKKYGAEFTALASGDYELRVVGAPHPWIVPIAPTLALTARDNVTKSK